MSFTPRTFLFFKPYWTLSQFTDSRGRAALARYGPFPNDVYPVGRLDYDSEGLLLLTNDARVNSALLHPKMGHRRTYWAQVEGRPDEAALRRLRSGVKLKDGVTKPAGARRIGPPTGLPPRLDADGVERPIRTRQTVPDSWIELVLAEGKNRQVRRMAAAVGHPVLRLARVAIGPMRVHGLSPGQFRPLSKEEREWLDKIIGRASHPIKMEREDGGSIKSKRGRKKTPARRV